MRFLLTTILKTACLLGLLALAGANALHAEERPQQPNFVILLADDISSDSFGCYGSPNPNTTPNIDKLAKSGIRFENMFVSQAVCAPARAELYTALMTQDHGNHAIRSREFRYIRYKDGFEELYADEDPWNHTNLAAKPEYADVLAQHRAHLPKTEAPGKPARHLTPDNKAGKQPKKDPK